MSTKLTSVNPYLRDPATRKKMVTRSGITSSAIDGIRAVFKQARKDAGKSAIRRGRGDQKKV
jgi:hypothetical protein